MMCLLLGMRGWPCIPAYSAQEALTCFATTRPDAVLLDLTLADESGVELCRGWRSQHPEVAIVALTAWRPQDLPDGSDDCGFDGILQEPVDLDDLEPALRAALAARRVGLPTPAGG